jgi:hypothetical protein
VYVLSVVQLMCLFIDLTPMGYLHVSESDVYSVYFLMCFLCWCLALYRGAWCVN